MLKVFLVKTCLKTWTRDVVSHSNRSKEAKKSMRMNMSPPQRDNSGNCGIINCTFDDHSRRHNC